MVGEMALFPFRRFYFEYGFFLDAYTDFEALIEILLGRELRLTSEETSITFASIGFGAKFSVLSALLARSEKNKQKLGLLTKANNAAARDAFAHGFIINKENQEFTHIRREVKNDYKVTKRSMTYQTMQSHAKAFYDATHEIWVAFGMTYDDVAAYKKWIAENAPKSAIQVEAP